MAEAQCSSSSSSANSSREDLVRLCNEDATAGACENSADMSHGKASACAAEGDSISTWEKLVQKQRSELMYELWKLQHGEKPVTGKDARQKVETFLQEQVNPSSYTRPERRDDDPMVLEVTGLIERRPVTSVLRSSDFKRDLENAIRGTIIRQEREADRVRRQQEIAAVAAAAAAPPVADDNWDTMSQSSYTSAISSHSSFEQNQFPWQPIPQPPVMAYQQYPGMAQQPPAQYPMAQPPLHQGHFTPPTIAHQPAPWWQQTSVPRPSLNMAHQWQQMPGVHPPQMYPGMPPQPMMQIPPVAQQQTLPPWQQMQRPPVLPPTMQGFNPLQRQQTTSVNTPQRSIQVSSMEAFRQAQREELVSEISELVQRRLVSQTLDGQFRGHLEVHLQETLQARNNNGPRVEQFVRSLRSSTQHTRNDFSNLGIHVPTPTGDSPTASMGVSNAAFDAMRHEIEELKNMIRLNFEMQLDIRRAICQEVAAAFAAVRGTGEDSQAQSCVPSGSSQPIQDGHCLICLDRSVDSVLYKCGHMCVCMTCGLRLKGQGLHCPMCRAPIRDVIRAYRCVAESSDNQDEAQETE
ncbi:uncharacterized protein [Ptychodera flava]|uniref:uncharacterized protein n=1 Tax=Ptychodera flava TaxID=63121 RepID=UPI00396AADA5